MAAASSCHILSGAKWKHRTGPRSLVKIKWLPEEMRARRVSLRKARVSLDQQLERLTEAYMGGVIRLEEYARRRRELEEKTAAFESQERELEQQADRRMELSGMVSRVEDYCRRVSETLASANFEQKRRLVELLIDRVIVTEAEVEIRYVIPTSGSGEHARFCHLRTNYLPSDAQKNDVGRVVAPLEGLRVALHDVTSAMNQASVEDGL